MNVAEAIEGFGDSWLNSAWVQMAVGASGVCLLSVAGVVVVGLLWDIKPVPPLEGATYNKSGNISFGLDMGHQGGGEDASEYSLPPTKRDHISFLMCVHPLVPGF